MAELTITFQPTPNPNSVKCVVNARAVDAPIMVASAAVADTPLATALLSVAGVHSAFLHPDFITITREPTADFAAIEPLVEAALRAHLEPE